MRINVRKIIDMWDKKHYTIEERRKEYNTLIKYYSRIINYLDLVILVTNICALVYIDTDDILEYRRVLFR